MQVTERRVGDVVIVAVNGDITVSHGGDVVLNDKIRSLVQRGHLKLLVDLAQVSYVDSPGLGHLVHAYATTKNAGGALKLLHLTKRLKDLLTITKLATVFDSDDDEPAALASF
jgi:anti-sigma B factor antagonist